MTKQALDALTLLIIALENAYQVALIDRTVGLGGAFHAQGQWEGAQAAQKLLRGEKLKAVKADLLNSADHP